MSDYLITNWPFLFLVLIAIFLIYDFSIYLEEKKPYLDIKNYNKNIFPAGVILSRTGNQKNATHINVFLGCLVVFSVAVFISILFHTSEASKEFDLVGLITRLIAFYSENKFRIFEHLLFAVFIFSISIISVLAMKNERLILTRHGIKYVPIFKSKFLRKFNSAWSIDWNDVKSISQGYVKAKNEIIIKTKNMESRSLQLSTWKELNNSEQVTFRSLIGRIIYHQKQIKDSDFSFKENVLSRYIIEVVGLEINKAPETDINFDLMSNKSSLGTVVLVFGLMVYSLVSVIISNETYVSDVPYVWFVIFGLIVAAISGIVLSKKKIPLSNVWGLALLLGVMMGIAMYPGMLNINQITDDQGLIEYKYRRVNDSMFEPVNSLLPSITMKKDEYWQSIPIHHEVLFMIRKGGLDFYQIDMEPEYKKMRQWYCFRKAGDDAGKAEKCRQP